MKNNIFCQITQKGATGMRRYGMRKVWLFMVLIAFCCPRMCVVPSVADGMTLQDAPFIQGLTLGMTKKAVIETVGAPEQVKSEGSCFAYPHLGISLFFDDQDVIGRIYIGPRFLGSIKTPGGDLLSLENATSFLSSEAVSDLTYTPSPAIHNQATVELEKATEPGTLPVEYRGKGHLFRLHGASSVLKYKRVFDDQGLALYFDDSGHCYAFVIYPESDGVLRSNAMAKASSGLSPQRLPAIHFDFDKSSIRPQDHLILDSHVEYMSHNKNSDIFIKGHTDFVGSDNYNMALSLRRSRAAYDYMVKNGVAANRLHVSGYGETRAVANNNTSKGRALNRRAEFTVYPSP